MGSKCCVVRENYETNLPNTRGTSQTKIFQNVCLSKVRGLVY